MAIVMQGRRWERDPDDAREMRMERLADGADVEEVDPFGDEPGASWFESAAERLRSTLDEMQHEGLEAWLEQARAVQEGGES